MPFHTFVYSGFAPSGDELIPTRDAGLATRGNGYVLPCAMDLIAGYGLSPGIGWAQINAPSLEALSPCQIRGLDQGVFPPNNPRLMTLDDSPIRLAGGEPITVNAAIAGGYLGSVSLWVRDRYDPVPAKGAVWVRYTGSVAGDGYLWKTIPLTYDQPFERGIYAVTGLEHYSGGCILVRLIFENQWMRPGAIPATFSGGYLVHSTHRYFKEGNLGVYGTFHGHSPPNVEVFVDYAAGGSHIGYLRVVKISDEA